MFDTEAAQYERKSGGCTRELARTLLDLPQLQNAFSSSAAILDNACGTAIVSEEIIYRCQGTHKSIPSITAVDQAPGMVAIAERKLTALLPDKPFFTAVMSGEKLDIPDQTFTHSITNLGLLFFSDDVAGVKEIYRTLKPGGIAVVTTWFNLGYLDAVIRPAQKGIRPNDIPFTFPLSEHWFCPNYVEKCLQEKGGFKHVEIQQRTVYYTAASLDEIQILLSPAFRNLRENWTKEEQKHYDVAMVENIKKSALPNIKDDGVLEFRIPMKAIIAICHKPFALSSE